VESAPYGSWSSPITAAAVAESGIRLSEPVLAADGAAWWLEHRPLAGGRTVLVRDGSDVTPEAMDVRTRVHEYGGGAWLLDGDVAFFSNYADQRLYRVDPGSEPLPITPEPSEPAGLRYADGRATPGGRRIVCVREAHRDGQVINELVALPADGSGEPTVLTGGRDFYSYPRPSPDGELLCWTCWDHPNMPWDGCELWLAPLERPEEARLVAGGPTESIWQPEWSPGGELHFVSDRGGWWNLYRDGERLTSEQAELGHPQWLFGGSTYAFLADGAIVCVRCERGVERLCLLRPGAEALDDLDLPYTAYGFPCVRAAGDRVVFVAASPREGPAIVSWRPAEGARVLRKASEHPPDPSFAPAPRAIEFPSADGRTAHAFYYPPTNPEFEGPEGERPPLIVQSHGGPTSHTAPELDMGTLFWTSRGIGVLDVNYGGSTGFGREYRERLHGGWGIVDVEDCVAAALHLAGAGGVDGARLAIHGGSAGGYAVLCALALHEAFAVGASYYGVADAETLARDTHKFESRYLDRLIGPYPEAAATYRERSPIHFVDRIRAPVILFQGLQDEVVPPSQAEQMVAALRANGVPHAYLVFEGEQHGFRKAETITRCLEAELSFYAQVLGFEPADATRPVAITAGEGR
jgi:dipeptidyl aminopeptidase/acylaminoacyl peptidase